MDDIEVMRTMTQEQRDLFLSEFSLVCKSKGVAFSLAFFLGGVGAHHFYLGRRCVGFVYLIFSPSLVPAVMAFIELFFILEQVSDMNRAHSRRIASSILNCSDRPF